MAILLHTFPRRHVKKGKRRGRGNASGRGTFSGRGQKGQKSRSGGAAGLRRRGLKQFLHQIPKKRGFVARQVHTAIVHLKDLEKFGSDAVVTPDNLVKARLIHPPFDRVKVLGGVSISKKLTVQAHAFSESAIRAIKKAGGKIIVMSNEK